MDLATILDLVAKAVNVVVAVAPEVIKGYEDAKPLALALFKAFSGKTAVTDEEEQAVYAMVQDLSAQLQAPLPPE